ncbi:hypothetical protein [Streptomyces sp. NPDC056938]|uniref:hypothetical protein n=1 Tax=Streptomyces sp. NPDC056938 TaxID=3345970 RepID=UPI003636350D
MAELFPDSLLVATDSVLDSLEAELLLLQGASDDRVFDAVQRVVLALNAVNDEHNGGAYETENVSNCASTSTNRSQSGESTSLL